MTARRLLRAAAVIVLSATTIAAAPPSGSEGAAAAYFASIRGNPSLLLAFLTRMPKGGDLHNHLSGAVYAESYLHWAVDDGLCVATATLSIVAGPCDASAGRTPAAAAIRNSVLFNGAIDALSMRHWDPSLNGHDHFFATFGKFGPAAGRTGDMLEYRKAVEEQGLDYRALKRMARNSIEYSFAEPATKTRLKHDLEAAFQTFERKHGDRRPTTKDQRPPRSGLP